MSICFSLIVSTWCVLVLSKESLAQVSSTEESYQYCSFSSTSNYFTDYEYLKHYRTSTVLTSCTDVYSTSDLRCQGAWSCENPTNLKTSSLYVLCLGEASCLDTKMEIGAHSNGGIVCYGSNSCENSIMSSAQNVLCSGQSSCANSNISDVTGLTVYGSYALRNSIVETNYNGTVYINIYGYNGAYNSSIKCSSGDTCYINCLMYGSSCIADGQDSVNKLTIICDGTCIVTNYPDTYNWTEMINDSYINNYGFGSSYDSGNEMIFMYDYQYYDDLCDSETLSIAYDNTTDGNNATLSIPNGGKNNVCCRKYDACYSSSISLTIEDTDSESKNVICNGYYSCRYMTMSISSTDNEGGIVTNENGNNIICSGYYSCLDMTLTGTTDVVLNSYVVGEINLICNSERSCYLVDVSSISNVYCESYYACYGASFSYVSNIYVTGLNGATSATITSNGIGEMNVYLLAYYAGRLIDVTCTQGDTCNVICGTSQACYNAKFSCEGNNTLACNVVCQSGFDCPSIEYVTPAESSCGSSLTTFYAYDYNYYADYINSYGKMCKHVPAYTQYCYGSYACAYPISLTANYYMYCSGDSACRSRYDGKSKTIEAGDAYDVFCYGSMSCFDTTIKSVDDIVCYGQFSCAKTYISDFDVLYAYSSYAISNSYIETNYGGSVSIYIYGYNAAYNTTIECTVGDICYIYCYFYGSDCVDGREDSLNKITILCDGTCYIYNSNTTYDITYDDSVIGTGWGNDTFEYLFDWDNGTMFLGYGSGYDIKNNRVNEFYFGYNSESYDDICSNSLLSYSYNTSSEAYGKSIHVPNNTIDNVCCRGYQSCRYADLSISDGGDSSSGSKNVICSAYLACQYVDITISNTNENNIICSGSAGCQYMDLYGGIDASNGGQINVVCGSYSSCYYGNIYEVSNVYCEGYQSCYGGEIEYVSNIYFTGLYSGSNGDIKSEGVGEMNVFFLGHHSGYNTDVHCSYNDTCNIVCAMGTACYNVQVFCGNASTCNVICVEGSESLGTYYGCPEIQSYDEESVGCSSSSSIYVYNYKYYEDYTYGLNKHCNQVTSSSGSLYCYGGYSCQYPWSLSSYQSMYCYGDSACARRDGSINPNKEKQLATTYSSNYYYVFCYGSRSCYDTEITHTRYVYCYGQLSCANSNISDFGTLLYGYGSYAVANSYIKSDYYGSSYIYLYGYNAAYNTTIECAYGSRCYIFCYMYNAQCSSTSVDSRYKINIICDGTCYIFNEDYVEELENRTDYKYGFATSYDDNTNDYYFGWADSDYYDNLCDNASISIKYDNTSVTGNYDTFYLTKSTNKNNFCCRGYETCRSSNAYMTISDQGSSESDAPQSKNVVCFGYYSCRYMDMYISTSNDHYGSLVSDDNNIVCSGYYSCYYINVYGSSSIASSPSSVGTVNMICSGVYACYYGDIEAISNLYCDSQYGCGYANIYQVGNLYFYGYYAGYSADIYSNGIGEMNVYFLGAYSGGSAKIYCNSGDICNVICATDRACYGVELSCSDDDNANCNVYCSGSDSTDCVGFVVETTTFVRSDALWVSFVIFAIVNYVFVGIVRTYGDSI